MAWMKSLARVYRTTADLQPEDIRKLYDGLNFPHRSFGLRQEMRAS